jgi:hypothetical protein
MRRPAPRPRLPIGDDLDQELVFDLAVGCADATLYDRHITDAERKKWRDEDAERDRHRIPLGFRAPAGLDEPRSTAP